MAGPITRQAAIGVRQIIAEWPADPEMGRLERLQRYLGKWRAQALGRTFITNHGAKVWGGLFEGMQYVEEASEGSLISGCWGSMNQASSLTFTPWPPAASTP